MRTIRLKAEATFSPYRIRRSTYHRRLGNATTPNSKKNTTGERFGNTATGRPTISRVQVPLPAVLGQDVVDVDLDAADYRARSRRGAHHALVENRGGVSLTA